MQWPGLTQETPATFLEKQALAAIVGFVNQLLLHQAPCEPSPVRRAALRAVEPFTQAAGINTMNLRQQFKNCRGFIRPVLL